MLICVSVLLYFFVRDVEAVGRYSVLDGLCPQGRVEGLTVGLFGYFPFCSFVWVVLYF